MALIKCPECGKDVSNRANACPHCGYPFTAIHKEVKKRVEKPISDKTIVMPNFILGMLGILMLVGILRSKGGISGNINATIVSVLIILGATVAVNLPKKKSKILMAVISTAYLFAEVVCVRSLNIAPAYLILEIYIGINIFILIHFAKKNKIY